MRYHSFGKTGLFVSELCLGTMTFGGSEQITGQALKASSAASSCTRH